MTRIFVIYGTVICLLFAYASYNGWQFTDALRSGKWGPRGHSAYHK